MFSNRFSRTAARLRIAVPFGAAFAALGMVSPVHATDLTLGQAQQLALSRSVEVSGNEAAAASSREMAVAARQLPDPMLKFGVDNLPVNGADRFRIGSDFMTMRRIGVEQELPSSAKREVRAARYERMADKAAAEKAAAASTVARDTAIAWLELYYATAMLDVANAQVTQSRAEMVAAQAAYAGGRSSQADVLAARSANAVAQDRVSEIERRRLSAQIALARWVGPQDDLATVGSPDIARLDLDPDRITQELEHHPELVVLDRQEQVARAEVKVAQAERKPDWRVEVAVQQRGPGYSDMVSFGVAVPLQWNRKNRQDREIAAKLEQADQAHDEHEAASRTRVAETQAMLGEWHTGLDRVRRYRTEIVPLAQDRTQAVLAAYRGSKAALADVLGARSAELDARLQALQIEGDTARLWARLNFLFPPGQPLARQDYPTQQESQ